MKNIRDRLADLLLDEKLVDEWMNKPNKVLNGKSPNELIEDGRENELYRILFLLESGSPV